MAGHARTFIAPPASPLATHGLASGRAVARRHMLLVCHRGPPEEILEKIDFGDEGAARRGASHERQPIVREEDEQELKK
eukprot:CAMPEP_0179844808 /NCGR_PEP_ID=MMETSP0982-20121206/4562_1 /TAXON_ID=483367 /ORGANISM="non described non described, Strain CCMP 2436" /LENGTH=78 /DNA_ID=CAMNT_0021729581 /DNA_START=693 /DNA_END=928 /DNA_ORIENTATION=+